MCLLRTFVYSSVESFMGPFFCFSTNSCFEFEGAACLVALPLIKNSHVG